MNANKREYKSGMTLIELLIVLALMAGLATFALTSMDELSVRSRYDVTVKRMRQVDTVIRGDGLNAGRFVSDMGRLPTSLNELMYSDLSYGEVAFTNKLGCTSVTGRLFCGWSGPYLVPFGTNYNFCDGFGDNFKYDDKPVPYLTTTGFTRHAVSWLKHEISNSYASVTSCTLQVSVFAINPEANEPIWSAVQSTNSIAIKDYVHDPGCCYGEMVLYRSNVYRCINVHGYTNGLQSDATFSNWLPVARHNYPTEAKVILRIPDVSGCVNTSEKSRNILTTNPCTFEGLTPGVRSLMAYGFNSGQRTGTETVTTNAWWSGFRTIEIHPGANFVTLYLTEPLKAKAP